MFVRSIPGFLLASVAAALIGCSNPQGLDSVQVSPTAQALTVGQTAQFTASGTYGNASHESTQNITSNVTWSSSAPAVATVSSSGMATAVGAGSTTITANATGFSGPVTSSATLTVTAAGGGVAGGSIASIAVIPGSQSVGSPGQTTQFLAIGTTSSGATVNLTNQVGWSSSSTQIATVAPTTGLATAVGQGTSTITALYANTSGGTVVAGSATLTVTGGTTEKYTAVTITPASQALSASGQTSQLIALGTSGSTGLESDVTAASQIKWLSSIPTVATVSSSGLITGLSAGNSTITAELTNADGTVVSGAAGVTVSITPAPEPLLSLTIIPSSITLGGLYDTGQFLAIGTYATAPYVRDLTNSPNLIWTSDLPNVFPVDTNSGGNAGATAGIVTAIGNGTAVIIAEATNPSDGTIQTATATFNCPLVLPNPNGNPPTPGSCYPGSQTVALLSTITVYNEGLNATNWVVTAPSATGTQDVIHCGPGWAANGGAGGSVCVATYPIGTTILLTAPTQAGVNFGGWSYNCTPSDVHGNPLPGPTYWTAAGPNYCTVTLSASAYTSTTVGAIFN
jgi:uncharacterized protein YjdB